MMQQQNKRQDWLDRKAEKQNARDAQARSARYQKIGARILYWAVGIAVVASGGWWLVRSSLPKGPDESKAIPILGRNHIPDGSTAEYNSNPPTSGSHYANPAVPRFYDQELADEQVVHNLEHGHVWISYKPGVSEETKKALKKFAGSNVIVTPRSKNDADIALVAWGRLDTFNVEHNTLDTRRIQDFIDRYQNKGPENLSGFHGSL